MFCSVVIPTIGRSSLDRAVNSVLNQTYSLEQLEIIVVNDSGKPLADAEWQSSNLVRVIHTNRRERNFARNSGAAIAKGRYLYFLDDDDWLLPTAIKSIWELASQENDAILLYGCIWIVDEYNNCLAEINSNLNGYCFAQVMGGAWVPIQTSFIQTEAFFAVGGFKTYILGTEDLDLCRRLAFYGSLANTLEPIACLLRGTSWHTSTNYKRAPEDTKQSRDEILSEAGAFTRLLASADSSYWYGRIFRVYMSTMNWNLEKRRFAKATSRALFGITSIILSGKHTFSGKFWAGVKDHHVPDTLHFVMQALEHDSHDNSSRPVAIMRGHE